MKEKFHTITFEEKYGKESIINSSLKFALTLLKKAETAHQSNDLDTAINFYKESIQSFPTADAHTYLGWMYSLQGNLEEAILECHKAIKIDPDFGNPYNDIGCYLMQKKEYDNSLPWFNEAKKAARYEPRHFPYLNTSRVKLIQGKHGQAKSELHQALMREPDDENLKNKFRELVSLLN